MARREGEHYYKRKGVNWFIMLIYLILGIYFVNFPFQYFQVPEQITSFDTWIVFVGGLLMLYGAWNYLKARR